MKKNSNEMSTGAALVVTVGIMLFIGFIMNACESKCTMAECDNKAKENSRYCYMHDMSYRNYGNPDYNAVYKTLREIRTKQHHQAQRHMTVVHQVVLPIRTRQLLPRKRCISPMIPTMQDMRTCMKMTIMTGTDIGPTVTMQMVWMMPWMSWTGRSVEFYICTYAYFKTLMDMRERLRCEYARY